MSRISAPVLDVKQSLIHSRSYTGGDKMSIMTPIKQAEWYLLACSAACGPRIQSCRHTQINPPKLNGCNCECKTSDLLNSTSSNEWKHLIYSTMGKALDISICMCTKIRWRRSSRTRNTRPCKLYGGSIVQRQLRRERNVDRHVLLLNS